MSHKHAYQKLSDEAVFCRECGDIKRADPPVCTLPHYPVVYPYVPPVTVPYVAPWRPYNPPYWWTVTSGGTADTGTRLLDSSTITYEVLS